MIYGYSRVSTQQQVDSGQSLDVQRRAIEGYCMIHNLTLDSVFEESAISGSIPLNQRPQGAAMLAALKPGDMVITTKLDRTFRSALDALHNLKEFTAKKISLHMIDMGGDVTQGGMSKLMFTIASAFAEAERDRIRERIRDTKRHQKKQGAYLGGHVPFGFTVEDEKLIPNPCEQAALEAMRGLKGIKSLRQISAHVQKVYDLKLSHVAVRRILKAYPPQQ